MKSYNHSCQIITVLAVIVFLAFPLSLSADQIIFYDDFPSTTLNPANWTITAGAPTIDNVGLSEPSEPYSLRLNGNPTGVDTVESRVINLSGLSNGAELTYWYEQTGGGESPDPGDDLFFEYLNAASSWVELTRHLGSEPNMTSYVQVVVPMPSDAYHSGFKLRIRNNGTSGAFDDWFVDDVSIAIPEDLNVFPLEDLNSSGDVGGPFAPSSKNYTLTNTGPNSLDWTAAATQSWLDVTPGGGTLVGGASTTVDVIINADANTLPIGDYNDVVTFTNTTSGVAQTRTVILEVTPMVIACFSMDTDPGWSTQGQWSFGVPLGGGSHCGDPTSGRTGVNVYGYNLAGDYSNNMPEYHLTTTALDCFGFENVRLSFWRWLGIESLPYDQAKVEVSNNGSNWFIVWEHTGGSFCDGAWVGRVYDISSVADDQPTVYIRWTMGPTDGSVTYPGWNIDDVCLLGELKDDLTAVPPEDFTSIGYEGGPFVPVSKTYTLTNNGSNPLDWTAAVTQSWLDVTPTGGTLAGGASTTVDVIINADANTLVPGDYNDVITFTNTTSGFSQMRNVLLEVIAVPGEIEVTDTIPPVNDLNMPFGDVFIGLSPTEQITLKNNNPTYSLVVTDISLGGAYFEDFDDGLAQDWDEDLDENWEVVSGEYRAQSSIRDFMFSRYLGQEWENLSAQMSCRRGGDIHNSASLVLRASSNFDDLIGSGYVFQIVTDGQYSIWKQVGGSWSWLQSWTSSPAINPGTNILTATALGNSLQFFINDALVWSGADSDLISGHIGLGGHTDLGYTSTHYFDNVLVDEPAITSQTISAEQQWYNEHHYEGGTPDAAPENWMPPQYPGESEILPTESANLSSNGFQLENTPNLPAIIPPLGSIAFNVIFTPTELEDYETTVVIKSSDADEPEIEVLLSGRGIPEYLEIVPDANCVFSGHPGGPFVPSNASYQLTNNGPVNIDWTMDEPNWLDVHPSSGTLKPGYSITVTVTPNSQAYAKEEGLYNGQLLFTDITTTVEQIRNVILNVHTAPKIWAKPSSLDITIPYGETATQTLTIGNTGDSALNFTLSSRQTNFTPPLEQQPVVTGAGQPSEIIVSIPPEHDFTVTADVPYAAGQLLVRFAPINDANKPNLAQEEAILAGLTEAYGASIERDYEIVPGLSLVTLPEGVTVEEALLEFNNTEGVLYAQPNYEVKIDLAFPNDMRFNDLWGMHNTGQTGGIPDADIDAPEAWDIGTGSNQLIVAVIDTGVDYTHPDLAANIWVNEPELNGTSGIDDDGNGYVDDIYGYDFCNNDGDPMDDHYHGTHCAGTIGAAGNNGIGVAGVCWNVRIMAVKFLDRWGHGSTADAISSIEYSTLMGANLSNNSWGGGPYEQALKDAIDAAGAAGMLFVASAGNDSRNNDTFSYYPSSYDSNSLIAVLATDKYDNMSYFSNYGLTSVDIGAPGSEILSCEPGSRYQYLNGTSMAAPHVSGACALLWSMNPFLSNENVKNILVDTVDETLPGLCASGGRLNLYNAILETGTQWIGFEPEFGTVAVDSTNDVNVVFNGEQPPGTYQGHISILPNDPYTPELTIPVTMTVETIDYFTELFDPNGNDMANKTLTFRPDVSGSYYKACVNEANGFPIDPNGGTVILLDDDDYEQILLDGAYVNFYGTKYSTFYIGSNGYISFKSGDVYYLESFADHFNLPRISALFDDLDPSAGGTISFKQLNDRVVVTFENVPEYSLSNSNSFQIEMRFNGKIRITFLEIEAEDGLVGLSDGNDVPVYFIESNLSEYGVCSFLGDLNGDQDVDLTDYAIFASYWQKLYEDTLETVRDEFNAISFSGNDGTQYFSYDWQEIGESDGPSKGRVVVAPAGESNALWLGRKKENHGASREVDLSGSTFATLTFDWQRGGLYSGNDTTVDISNDGGDTWTTLLNIPDGDETSLHSESFDISSLIAPDTQLRFIANEKGDGYIYFDNIQIEYGGGVYEESWCGECDFNPDLVIDGNDLLIFVQCWLN